MRTLRTALTAAVLGLLCAGYAASQLSYFQGTFMDYAARVDSPPVQRLALLFLIAAIVLAFVPDRDVATSGAIDPTVVSANSDVRVNSDPHRLPFTPNDLRFTIYDSRFTIHDSRFTIHDSRFTIHDSRFTIHHSPFTIRSRGTTDDR